MAKKNDGFSFEKTAKNRTKIQKSSLEENIKLKKQWSLVLKPGRPKKRFYPEVSVPVLNEGVIYLGTQSGEFYAIEAKAGTLLWKRDVGAPVATQAAIGPQALYFSDLSGQVQALSKTGEPLWQVSFHQELVSPITLLGDFLYFAKGDKEIICLSATNGQLLWSSVLPTFNKKLTLRGQAKILSDGPDLLAAMADGQVYRLKAKTGQIVTSYAFAPPLKTFKDIDAELVSDAEAFYVAGYFGEVHKVSRDFKNKLWTLPLGSGVAPVLWDDKILIADLLGDLHLYDKNKATLFWKTEFEGQVLSEPVIINNVILVGSSKEKVYLISKSTGEILYKQTMPGGVLAKPWVIEDHQVVVMDTKGGLHSFEVK